MRPWAGWRGANLLLKNQFRPAHRSDILSIECLLAVELFRALRLRMAMAEPAATSEQRPSRGRKAAPPSTQPAQRQQVLITPTDCHLRIKSILLEMRILLASGGIFLGMSFIVVLYSGIYAEPGVIKIVSGAFSFP